MLFIKKPGFILLSKNVDLEVFSHALYGFILTSKNNKTILFTNSLTYLDSIYEEYEDIKNTYQNKNYDLKIVFNENIIDNPDNQIINDLEKVKHYTLFSSLAKKLINEGYKITQNTSDIVNGGY